jgi:Ca2+-binding EF-hand superfamily protein
VAILVLVLGFSAWNKQRPARTALPEATRPAPEPKPAFKQPSPDPREAARDRPERDRADRPGDKQAPGLEEFRRKVFQEFRSGDRDDDGYLSREEVRNRFPAMEREFARVDADSDGRISPEEFLRMRRFQAQQRLKKQ